MGATAAVIGALRVTLGLDSAAFEKGAGLAERRMASMQKSFATAGERIAKVGAVMTIGITAPFTALIAKAIPAATESAQATGQVTAALKSMGDAAGRTLPQLEAQATALMHLSTFDDDDIMRKVTANMLTFGNVSGEAFDRAQKAAIDLSARLGTDLQASTLLVGKALNDPIKGMTALSRAGIQFTADQKAQIAAMVEAGNAAGAQKIILAELERQFSGSAKAMRDATPGIEAKQAWDDFNETVGKFALEVLPPLTSLLAALLEGFNNLSPGMQKFALGTTALLAVLGPVVTVIGGLVAVLPVLASGLIAIGTAIFATAIPAIGAFIVAMSPILIPLGLVAAAITGIVVAVRNWDKIADFAKRMYQGIKIWVMDKLGAVWDWLMGKIKAVGAMFEWLYEAVVGHSYIPDMVDGIAKHMARLDSVMVDKAAKTAKSTADVFREMAGEVKGLLDRLFPEAAALRQYQHDLETLAGSGLSPDEQREAKRRLDLGTTDPEPTLLSQMAGWADPLRDTQHAVTDLIDKLPLLGEQAKTTSVRVAKSFGDMAQGVLSSFQSLTQSIKGGGFLDILSAGLGFITQLGEVGAFGKTIQGRINKTPGLAGGGSFMVGGNGGIDRNVLSINGQPRVRVSGNERVTVTPPGNDNRGGGLQVSVVKGDLFDVIVTHQAAGVVAAAAPVLVGSAVGASQANMQRRASRSLRR